MINNLELIKPFLDYPNERSFYFVQILKRKKENPEMSSCSLPIESYYIFSNEQLDRVMPHIIDRCEQNRARAYIKLNTLDAESVGLMAISVLSEEIRKQDWHALSKCFNSACGQCGMQINVDGQKRNKLYLVDLDDIKGKDEIDKYIAIINKMQPTDATDKVKLVVPTQHGTHLITTGFDLNLFHSKFPDIDIHKDGNTILYYPSCCD